MIHLVVLAIKIQECSTRRFIKFEEYIATEMFDSYNDQYDIMSISSASPLCEYKLNIALPCQFHITTTPDNHSSDFYTDLHSLLQVVEVPNSQFSQLHHRY
jgi:hypothetical protein